MVVAADLQGKFIPKQGECPICRSGRVYKCLRLHLSSQHGLPPRTYQEQLDYTREAMRRWRQQHPEAVKAARRRFYIAHVAELSRKRTEYNRAHREQNRAYQRRYQKFYYAATKLLHWSAQVEAMFK